MFITFKKPLLLGLIVLLSSVSAEEGADISVGDDASVNVKNTCAMRQVLQAMNELLTLQSAEIRELKKQVQNSCSGKQSGGRPPSSIRGGFNVDDDNDLFGSDFDIFKEDDKEKDVIKPEVAAPESVDTADEDTYGYDGDEQTPANDLMDGISKWWDTILPFAPKPEEKSPSSTTTPAPPPFPVFPDYENIENTPTPQETDDYGFGDLWFPPLTTTTEQPISYTLPPEPYSCPQPFRLQASGCYLVFQDQREWRSWGEAHALCQSYGGSLAAPWRFRELQEFLSRYYSDAFWVGASFDSSFGSWNWLSGRRMENSEWKRGQPNRNPGMKCVFLDKWSGYKANNFFCGEKYPFICEHGEV